MPCVEARRCDSWKKVNRESFSVDKRRGGFSLLRGKIRQNLLRARPLTCPLCHPCAILPYKIFGQNFRPKARRERPSPPISSPSPDISPCIFLLSSFPNATKVSPSLSLDSWQSMACKSFLQPSKSKSCHSNSSSFLFPSFFRTNPFFRSRVRDFFFLWRKNVKRSRLPKIFLS